MTDETTTAELPDTETPAINETSRLSDEGDTPAGPEGSDLKSEPGDGQESISDGDPDQFPRAYVEQLRNENARYRQRAGEADALAQRLHTELVRATGRLADPTDLPFDIEHLEGDNLSLALDELLASKPHLAARKPIGDIGQGSAPSAASVDLAAILRGRAG